MFRFIYCGKIDLTKLQGPDVLKLLIVVKDLEIQTSLIPCVQEYLIKHQYKLLQQNPVEILETVYQYKTFTDLLNFCLEKICKEPEILFNSDKFVNLKAPLLELFLKRDDLSLDEIVIWDKLIKWNSAQHPSIQQDVKKWSKEEIIIMERSLHRFIPLVRFHNISSEDFYVKVYPFRVILPEDLFDNILAFHMAPSKNLNINKQPLRQREQREHEESDENGKIGTRGANEKRKSSFNFSFNIKNKLKELFAPKKAPPPANSPRKSPSKPLRKPP